MAKSKEFKILLLSDAVMAQNEGGICQTLYNVFSFVEPQNLLAIAPTEHLKVKQPSPPFTRSYKSYRYSWINISHNRITKPFLSFVEWLNFSICQLRRYKKLKKAISVFDPHIIVSCPNSPIGVLMHQKLLFHTKYNDRVVVYFMDDWMYQSSNRWLGGNVNDIIKIILTQSTRWMMISDELANILSKRYHTKPKSVLTVHNPVDISNAPDDKPYVKGSPFTIAYAGALWPMHYDSFYAFAKSVKSISIESDIQLIWYAPQNYWDWRKNELISLGVTYGGHIPYNEIHDTLNKADALLITSSFKEEYYSHSKGSLQTKITDYCKAKRLIISCGPKYSANHNFIRKMNCGICIETENEETITEQLQSIIDSADEYQTYVINGWDSLRNFTKEVVHNKVESFLTSAIKETV